MARVVLTGTHSVYASSIVRHIEDALKKTGHEVTLFDYIEFHGTVADKIKNRLRIRFPAIHASKAAATNKRLLQLCQMVAPDLLLIIKGEVIEADNLAEIRTTVGCKIVNWCSDTPFEENLEIKGLQNYDHVFVFDPYYVERLLRLGAPKASYLPMACDPDFHTEVTLTDAERRRYSADISFVGSWYPVRERVLEELVEFQLKIWGGGWKVAFLRNPLSPLLKHYQGVLEGNDAVKALIASKISINIHHPQSVCAPNMRTFEVPCCGGFQLVENLPEIGRLFRVGEEVVCYQNVRHLKELIKYYLERPDERLRVARAGQRRVRQEHTYVHRLRELLATVGVPQ